MCIFNFGIYEILQVLEETFNQNEYRYKDKVENYRGKAKLTDLNSEDKEKIGKLIKRLSQVQQERELYKRKYGEMKNLYLKS